MDDFYTYNPNSGYFPEDVEKIEPWKQGFSFGDAGRGETRPTYSNRQQPTHSRQPQITVTNHLPNRGSGRYTFHDDGASNRQPEVTVTNNIPNRSTGRFSFGDIGRGESKPSTGKVHLSFGTGMGQPSVTINGQPVSSSNLDSSPVRFEWLTTDDNGQRVLVGSKGSRGSSRIGV